MTLLMRLKFLWVLRNPRVPVPVASLNPTLHLLCKKLSAKSKLDPEMSSLDDALRRSRRRTAQRETGHARTWLREEGHCAVPSRGVHEPSVDHKRESLFCQR
jgi:hypothetical protein